MATSSKPAPLVIDERLPGLRAGGSGDAPLRLNALIYGKPGAGKTMLAASAADDPRTSPVLFVDAEGGTINVSHKNGLHFFDVKNPDELRMLTRYLREATAAGDLPFKTLVLDSLTDIAEKAMDSIVQTISNPRRAVSDVEEGADWNVFNHRMMAVIRFFRDLDVHLIATALEREDTNGFFPAVKGKQVPQQLPGAFNTVGHLRMVPKEATEERRLLLQSSAKYAAKDRGDPLGVLPREMVDPTITKLLDRMEEGRRLALAANAPTSNTNNTKR